MISMKNFSDKIVILNICFYYLSQSPWIGNGIAFTWEYVLPQNEDLLGAESLWIPVLIDQGILGAVAVSSMFVACMIYLIKHNAIRYTIVVLGFLVFNSMSSIPNISITDFVYYVILLCMFIPNKKNKSLDVSFCSCLSIILIIDL